MAITRLKRKGRRNKTKSTQRNSAIKLLTATPVIKNVDVEALKQGFEGSSSTEKKAPKAKNEEVAETTAVKQEEPLKNHPTEKE